MSHEILNRQRKVRVVPASYSHFLDAAFEAVKETRGCSATVVLVSDKKMRLLNRSFRGKDSTTDVLSFPMEGEEFQVPGERHLGDVVISLEQAARQASSNGLTLQQEMKRLMLHGLLHLCGFDHETDQGEMAGYERKLRRRLGI